MKRIAGVMLALILAACGKPGADFEGKWAVPDQPFSMTIERNADTFLVKLSDSTKPNEQNPPIPAVLKDGQLVLSTFANPTITYVKSSGTLLMSSSIGGYEFKRSK